MQQPGTGADEADSDDDGGGAAGKA